jgi:hypothetical protein
MTPQAWCGRVLGALTRRRLEARKSQRLELLLRYFIDLDPSTQEFDALLARHATDVRPTNAAVAQQLEQAWLRTRIGTLHMPVLALQETLRTLGALLDEYDTEAGYLAVVGDSTTVQPLGEWKPRALEPLELLHEIAARTALRGQIRHADPGDPTRYETRLRAVGAELDLQPRQAYQFLVSRQTIVVEGSAGCYEVYTTEALAPHLQTLLTRRDGPPPEVGTPTSGDALAREVGTTTSGDRLLNE